MVHWPGEHLARDNTYITSDAKAVESGQDEDAVVIRRCSKTKAENCSDQNCKVESVLSTWFEYSAVTLDEGSKWRVRVPTNDVYQNTPYESLGRH